MADILKFIVNDTAHKTDPDGHMFGLEPWSPELAESRARAAGLSLTPRHWEVIGFLRAYYKEHGPVAHARELSQALNQRFAIEGGSRFLYRLFAGGPVTRASYLAGLPAPADAKDDSFGTSV